jgi:diguanylate cyclase (GGDEF)-like protein/PAS domain S-box-containing protein
VDALLPDTSADEHEALLSFLYMCPAGLLQLDAAGVVQLANPPAAQMLLPLQAVPSLENLFDCLDRYAPEIRNLATGFTEPRGTICENHRIHVSQGSEDPMVLSCTLLRIRPDCLMAVLSDVSTQVAQEIRLQQAESWFGTLLAGVHDFVHFSLDSEGKVDGWNASAQRYTGFAEEEVLGRTLQLFYGTEAAARGRAARQIECAQREGWAVDEWRCIDRSGDSTWMQSLVAALRKKDSEMIHGFSVVLRDITERKMSTEELRRLLTTDHLTGAANRAHLFEIGAAEVARWKRSGSLFSAILLDADHFKQVNDTFGHPAGDAVLCALVERCREGLRAVDTLARYGGEEFVVLLPGLGAEDAKAVAERLRRLVAERPMNFGGISIPITLSLGCASMGKRIETLEALLTAADAATYRAKRLGRNRVEADWPELEGLVPP